MFDLEKGAGEIHVPRTAGTSRYHSLQDAGLKLDVGSWHFIARQIIDEIGIKKWKQLFSWTFRRNPLEVVLSTFNYRQTYLTPPNNHIIPKEISFEEWLLEYVDYEETSETHPIARGLEIRTHLPYWIDHHGELTLCRIYDFEDMDLAMKEIGERLDLEIKMKDINGTGRPPWRDHYTPEMQKIVEYRFQKDFATLGPTGKGCSIVVREPS